MKTNCSSCWSKAYYLSWLVYGFFIMDHESATFTFLINNFSWTINQDCLYNTHALNDLWSKPVYHKSFHHNRWIEYGKTCCFTLGRSFLYTFIIDLIWYESVTSFALYILRSTYQCEPLVWGMGQNQPSAQRLFGPGSSWRLRLQRSSRWNPAGVHEYVCDVTAAFLAAPFLVLQLEGKLILSYLTTNLMERECKKNYK